MSGRGRGQRKRHGEGSFHTQKKNPREIEFADFHNSWTFANLCLTDDDTFFEWLREHGLLPTTMMCHCGKMCKIQKRSKSTDGYCLRCPNGHELAMRKNSFFQGSAYNLRDLLLFIKNYIDGHSLHQSARSAGMEYRHTSVNWGSYVREMFSEHVYRTYQDLMFEGEVEIDESIFGAKIKYHKGKPRGHRIWIFGIVERNSNRLILYPVDRRDAATLIPIIQKHVRLGATVYSDNWAAYSSLNELGYEHFSVTHKTTFKQSYKNAATGEVVHCNTNTIEGSWKIAKDHFRYVLKRYKNE